MTDSPVQMGERALRMAHVVERPSWNCQACGKPWPCLVARVSLKAHMTDMTLRTVMAGFAHAAIADGLRLTTELYDRIVGWIDADQRVKRYFVARGTAPVSPRG